MFLFVSIFCDLVVYNNAACAKDQKVCAKCSCRVEHIIGRFGLVLDT